MTDTSHFPVKAFNAPDLSHASISTAFPAARHQHYHAPADVPAPVVEDDGQINCICGFADDDGWTVLCEVCNRWQHQSCYYPQYDEIQLPTDLSHTCVECQSEPHDIDVSRARQRQFEKRHQPEPQTNGVKRTAPKSHKKKVKEPVNTYTNGWPLDKVRHDRNSASPRDQQPPAKRPKTSHRTSDSTTTTTAKGHSRKRNVSNVNHRRSLSRSPEPIEQYSEEFLQCYQNDQWVVKDTNLHNSIAVTTALSEWLSSSDEEFHHEHNQAKGEVLMRWDGHLDDIPGKAQIDIIEERDETVRYNGQHPSWKTLTVKEPVANGGYIGELKGHVGFKKDYQSEGTNRWAQLRHPEPFVFFHQRLPIFVDARDEGTELRYVRRSCMPNARLQILITDNVNYHFCFMATQQIEPGMEVSVGWDTNDGLPELASRNGFSDDELEQFSSWVSTALANCGPCACQLPEKECYMSRFDRRRRDGQDDAQSTKSKGKKRKANHISPINTNTINSRSGSEARKVDPDDDGIDSRSTSTSAGRGSASRDITPNTHYSTNGHATSELSERERKKLAKEEEIFKRQDEDKMSKQAKSKKRSSAGSNLNTPSATSSKQLGFPSNNHTKYVDSGTSKQNGLPPKAGPGRKPKIQKTPSRPSSRIIKRAKPVYVDAETQCDLDAEDAQRRAPTPSSRKHYVPVRQRLLDLCARNNAIAFESQSRHAAPILKGRCPPEKMDVEPDAVSPRSPVPTLSIERPQRPSSKDVEMEDATDEHKDVAPVDLHAKSPSISDDTRQQSVPVDPPAPPWPPKASSSEPEPSSDASKPNNMHLQMPPPPANPFAAAAPPLSAGTPSTAASSIVQSPATLGQPSIFSPSVNAAVAPSPAKKKLSLSDYTRRKAKVHDSSETSKVDRESSPASTNSGPVVPPLQPSSSAEAKAAEGGSAIDEDVKMEDAGDSPAVKA